MKPLPALLSGAIAQEYGEVALSKRAHAEEQTETCGSACTDARDCEDTTCGGQQEEEQRQSAKHKEKKKAFFPAVPGWNEPPAASL
jgi:hypothetical protein